jgi:Flp pilus assembly protein TadD
VAERAEPLRAAAAEKSLGRSLWNAGRADEAIVHFGKALRLVPEQPRRSRVPTALPRTAAS